MNINIFIRYLFYKINQKLPPLFKNNILTFSSLILDIFAKAEFGLFLFVLWVGVKIYKRLEGILLIADPQ